ncbi:DUF4261 domain-containing protein [Gordonia sp. HY285]|uniref:DUF4261 domain-containing protein n=1 Tax=Gordonia liuliyuniae TaxID=2911517 RepID=UPI001F374670|nr:DUF4261 domain-containing protein [Gordonia liuliyuniae]MCF8610754.1 DUF4261 domain-containing protein [Gordonia liuliyuniae]
MPSLAMLFQSHLDSGLTGDRLRQQMLADFPDLTPASLTVDAAENADEDRPLTLSYGDTMIALMSVPAAVGDDLQEIAEHSRLWPESTPVPASYDAHTIVTVLRPRNSSTSYQDAIADAVLLSKVIASAIAVSDSIVAVYFGSANHVIVPELFRDLTIETLPDPILPAWVALNVAPRTDGVMTGHTRGLDMLGLMDIEIVESPETAEETFARLANISIYQLQSGPVIGDGHSLGTTDDAELFALHAPSALDPDKTVLQLTFAAGDEQPVAATAVEPQSKKRGWFRRK